MREEFPLYRQPGSVIGGWDLFTCTASHEIFLQQPNILELEALIKICVLIENGQIYFDLCSAAARVSKKIIEM
ncbi:hypothetical protein M8C21_018249 [Ambrosia artemisiifolia]|uniref:Uncharacterized protein n=1 Tax=Ambrosia artemisiifolia TaxID=4212 RepID=A0AAD5BXE6_AMBAR|nr:hypothetical protein M8C21_018249 [Ambrosia artemisiifolia]